MQKGNNNANKAYKPDINIRRGEVIKTDQIIPVGSFLGGNTHDFEKIR